MPKSVYNAKPHLPLEMRLTDLLENVLELQLCRFQMNVWIYLIKYCKCAQCMQCIICITRLFKIFHLPLHKIRKCAIPKYQINQFLFSRHHNWLLNKIVHHNILIFNYAWYFNVVEFRPCNFASSICQPHLNYQYYKEVSINVSHFESIWKINTIIFFFSVIYICAS